MEVEFFIKTSIDKLIKLVREKKRLKLSEAAKVLNVSQKKIDEWVFMLEDKGIVDLKYPVLGEPEIVLKHEVSEEGLAPRKDIKVETRIIPGKPIKKEELPVFKPGKASDKPYDTEKQPEESYESIADELRSLESRISNMAAKRSSASGPSNDYITEKLKFLESRVQELTRKSEENEKHEADKIILEKLGTIEERLDSMSKKVNKEDSTKELKKKKIRIEATDNV